MTQSALSKERRELREQQQRTLLEAIPKDLSRPWEDPLPEAGERHLAQVRLVNMPSAASCTDFFIFAAQSIAKSFISALV